VAKKCFSILHSGSELELFTDNNTKIISVQTIG